MVEYSRDERLPNLNQSEAIKEEPVTPNNEEEPRD